MAYTYMRSLTDIAGKPDSSPTTQLIATRRICRVLTQRIDAIDTTRRVLRRKAAKLKQALPFTRHAVANMARQDDEYGRESRELYDSLDVIGIELLMDKKGLADSLGFDRLCDVMSLSQVRRDQARQEGESSIFGLACSTLPEGSTDLQRDAWVYGDPLLKACCRGWVVFARESCARGIDPFAPGEAFGPKLAPKLRVV